MAPKPKGREARFTLRLSQVLKESIERCAAEDRRTMSDWIVITLEDAVAARKTSGSAKPVSRQR